MKILRYSIITAVLAILVLSFSIPLPLLAGSGIAVAPSIFNITDALREANYERTVSIINTGDQTTTYSLKGIDQAGSWLSFFDLKGAPVDQITVGSGETGNFIVHISIPQDAANGQYIAKAEVTTVASNTSSPGSGQTILLAADSTIVLEVSGTQVISGTISTATAEDTELGYPLKIQLYFNNTGNIEVAPLIKVKITQNGTDVDSFNYNLTSVGAGHMQPIDVAWDTTGKAPADYDALVTVLLDSKVISEQNLKFKILPLGALTRSGELKNISIEGNYAINNVAKIIATFTNTGQIDTMAVFTGEVYFNGTFTDTIQSEALLVAKGGQGQLVAYFKPVQVGTYTIKGHVTFEGKQTEVKQIDFKALSSPIRTVNPGGNTNSTVTGSGWNPLNLIYVIGGVIVVGIIVILALRSKKSSKR